MAATKKNSLVNNINKKKKAGTSKTKSKSTISKKTYDDLKENWVIKNRALNKKIIIKVLYAKIKKTFF